jgi:hypothetical protein
MATSAQVLTWGVIWLANFMVVALFTLLSGFVFSVLKYVTTVVPISTSYVTYSSVQYIFPMAYVFFVLTLVAISYRIYTVWRESLVYQPGM